MRALDRKVLRNLWAMKGQALAIAMVIVGGIATFVMSLSTLDSLRLTRATFYDDYRFADVFVSLKRAPESLRKRMEEIPGVQQVETRVVAGIRLEVEGFGDPVTGRAVSIPDGGEPMFNSLFIRKGRYIHAGRDDEVMLSEAFAEAHGFEPGDTISAIINGRRKAFSITGIVLSPEFIYQLSPGAVVPDFKRYGILWMSRRSLATAYGMQGAFNDAVLSLSAGAREGDVLDRLDELLEPYGGLGAYGRRDQISHRYLSEEFRQLGHMATIFPTIFIAVAAFLLNVVMGRLVDIQREQAAALKAFGYRSIDIGVHYVKLVALIVLAGVCGGIAAGIWLGKGLSRLYMDFYRLPFLHYELSPSVVVSAVLISAVAAVAGTIYSVRRAAMLPPAQAMRPEPPAVYRESLPERMGLRKLLSQPTKMIVRHVERKPVKTALTITGIALACAILVFGSFFDDAIRHIINVQFGLAQREDLVVTLTEPTSRRALNELRSLRGVEYAEPYRAVPARFRFGHRSYRSVVQGLERGGRLRRLLGADLKPFDVPPEGIVLTDHLGAMLGVRPGDTLTVEVLEGNRPVREVQVAGFVKEFLGVSGYMELGALNRMMGEGHAISGAFLAVDSPYLQEVYDAINVMPRVAAAENRADVIDNFRETLSEQILIYATIITVLAAIIAFGVVYNSARISLSERSRELASLRVLGFTRGEISYILLGELGLLTLLAIPPGFLIGRALCAYLLTKLQTDLYRIPLVLEPSTYAFAATVVLVSATVSSLVVRRRLDQLDLVSVLKTKE